MDTKILVEEKFEEGKKLIEALDKRDIFYPIYLWANLEEKDSWLFLIGVDRLSQTGAKNNYRKILKVIKEEGLDLSLNSIALQDTNSDLMIDLKKAISQKGIGRIIFTGNFINNRRFPDSIIYRVE